jgi:Zn-dependent protease with chaperone function
MEQEAFDALITRLERSAAKRPVRYRIAAVSVALLGFLILALAFGFAFIPAAALIALGVLVAFKATAALLLVLIKLGKLVLLLAIPAWTMLRSSVSLLFSRFPPPQGRELTRAEAPALYQRLDELRRRLKGPAIHRVLVVDEINAAIVQHPRFGLLGWERNVLILGLPLLQSLGEGEAMAVLAHEYGHLSGYHGRLGGFIYRFRAAWSRLQQLSGQWTDWGSRLIARLFRWYAPYFNAYTFVLARQNEFVADQTAVEIAGRQNAANALIRTSITSQFAEATFWPSIERRIVGEPEPPGDRSAFWEQSLRSDLDSHQRARFLDVARQRRTDHMNTHPALKDRLAAIGARVDEEAAQHLEPPRVSAASVWLAPSVDKIAAEMDGSWRARVAESWRKRHAQLREQQQRLAELDARQGLTVGELWERVALLRELHFDSELMPAIENLLSLAPDHSPGRFQRGIVLLQRGEETGIADLEFAMGRDKEAVPPGCEAAWRFYSTRDGEKAKSYAQRWQEGSNLLVRIRAERATLGLDAEFVVADVTPELKSAVTKILVEHAPQVCRAYVVRRILKTDPSLLQYVLAFETDSSAASKGTEIVKELAQQPFPGNFFVLHLGTHKQFRKKVEQLGVAPVFAR